MSARRISEALRRDRLAIATVAATYAVAVVVGAAMVHAGNGFALDARDGLVARAHTTDRASIAVVGLPRQALIDVGAIYVLALPLFLVASLWEFLAR